MSDTITVRAHLRDPSDDDVDRCLDALRSALVKTLNDGKRISL